MNQAVSACDRSGWIDTMFMSLHADAVRIHCPPIHILVQPRYIRVLSYALLPSTIQMRRAAGMAISLNRQVTGFEFAL